MRATSRIGCATCAHANSVPACLASVLSPVAGAQQQCVTPPAAHFPPPKPESTVTLVPGGDRYSSMICEPFCCNTVTIGSAGEREGVSRATGCNAANVPSYTGSRRTGLGAQVCTACIVS